MQVIISVVEPAEAYLYRPARVAWLFLAHNAKRLQSGRLDRVRPYMLVALLVLLAAVAALRQAASGKASLRRSAVASELHHSTASIAGAARKAVEWHQRAEHCPPCDAPVHGWCWPTRCASGGRGTGRSGFSVAAHHHHRAAAVADLMLAHASDPRVHRPVEAVSADDDEIEPVLAGAPRRRRRPGRV